MPTTTHVLPGTPHLTYDETGPTSGPLLICLHGLSADRTSWSPVNQRFGDRWRVCALDFRGHGQSGHSTGGYTLSDYRADAERLLDHLGQPAVIVGHSLGAIVAVELAQRAHPQVRAVFLEDPPLYVVGSDAPAGDGLRRTFLALRDHCQRLRAAGAGRDAFEELLASVPQAGGRTLGDRLHHDALVARAGALRSMDLDAVTALLEGRTFAELRPSVAMKCPVTVVRADPQCDAAFLPEHEELLRAANPCAEVVALPGGGHNLRGDRATRDAYLDLLAVFLARHVRRTDAVAGDERPRALPAEHGTRPIEHFLDVDGRRIAYARTGPDSDAALVFVHGWPDSWRSWQPVMEHMPGSTHAVAISLGGFGRSDDPTAGFTPQHLAADVAAVVGHLGLRSIVLVGHSLGSVVVQHLAASLRETVAGVVLVGGFARLGDEVAADITSALAELDDLDEDFVRSFQASTLARPIPHHVFERIVAESLQAELDIWRSTFAGLVASEPPPATSVDAPVLLLWGDQDVLVTRAEQERLLASLPDARLTVYAGGGHSPNWEQPEVVAGDILRFAATVALGR